MHRIPLLLILICLSGCRSPQTILHTFQQNDPGFVSVSSVDDTAKGIVESHSIEDLVQLGLSRNPRIQEAQHKIDALRHRIPQVLSLPDPMLNSNTYLAPVQTAAGEQDFSIGVSQKITNPDRRATSAAIVSDEIAAAEANLQATRLEIAEQVRTACYQLLFIQNSILATNADSESLAQIAEVIVQQYEVKQSVTQQDVLNVQVEQSKVENQLSELKQKEKSYQARLSRLLRFDQGTQFDISDQLQTSTTQLDADDLIAEAIHARPDLQSQLAAISRERRKIRLANLEGKPDFTVGLNWIATSSSGISPVANGDDALLLGIGFNLPIYQNRIRAGVCEAQANHRAAESRFTALQDAAAEEVFDLVAKLESTKETLALIQDDILPKSERTLEVSIEEYSTGKIKYVQLIENWRSVLRYRIAKANLQSQYSQLLASLARSIGQLEPIDMHTDELAPGSEAAGNAGSPVGKQDLQN